MNYVVTVSADLGPHVASELHYIMGQECLYINIYKYIYTYERFVNSCFACNLFSKLKFPQIEATMLSFNLIK